MESPNAGTLTDAQREIMEVFWKKGEATVTEVRDALSSKRDLARNTVQTMIVRLEERGWLKHHQIGRKFVYSAKRPRILSLGAKVSKLVDAWFGGAPEEMVTALLEYRGTTTDEVDRIRHMIERAEQKNASSKRK